MEQRTNDFLNELGTCSVAEIKTWGNAAFKKWVRDWDNYIKTGTDRPPKPPKVP